MEDFIKQEAHNICLIHFAPPCGTCSAARKRKLPAAIAAKLHQAGVTPPQPLRSEAFPMGLPGIAGLDLYKVQQANVLYHTTKRLALLAIPLNIRVSIENPTNSLFWMTTPIVELLSIHPGYHNVFHSCMMGGDRQKQTTWWCNDNFFASLHISCTQDHAHKPWTPTLTSGGVHYPTKDEAEYPKLLCQRVAALLVAELRTKGIEQPSTLQDQISSRRTTAINSVAMGLLPRGQKLRPLVSEFGDYVTFVVKPETDASRILCTLNKGARITDRKLLSGGDSRVSGLVGEPLKFLGMQSVPADMKIEMVTFGLPREPWNFVKQAAAVGHPRFLPYAGTEQLDMLLKANLSFTYSQLEENRIAFFKKWLARARELEDDESKLRLNLGDHVKQVLKGKRLLVFKEMLAELGFPDTNLISDIITGFRLSGWMRDSQVFMSLPRPPKMTLATLLKSSAGLQHAVLRKVAEADDPDIHRATWDETQAECERQWIWEDTTGDMRGKIIAHRFGIRQNEKVRVIDNFKQCGLNDACGLPEKFTLHGVDYIAASLIRALVLQREGERVILKGKTFDLKSAYKQFPIHELDRKHLRIALCDPSSGPPKLYGLNSLPFGATGSVAGFLRVSSALFFILSVGLRIWCSAFFDDFPTMAAEEMTMSTDKSVGLLFDLLGIQFAKEGKKCQTFGHEMRALGLIFDLTKFSKGKVFIRHTAERQKELLAKISEILADDALSPKDAESFKGRIQWFESFLFGRSANLAVHRLGKRALAQGGRAAYKLDDELRSSLKFLQLRVEKGAPLELSADTEDALLVFIDGAFNDHELEGTVGGVLLDHHGSALRYFSERVPDLLMKKFLDGSANPIYLIELLATYIAVFLWGGISSGRYVVMYVDNEASRMALIKAYSSTDSGNVVVQMFVKEEDHNQWKVWWGRVGTYANVADAPSRLDVKDVEARGAQCDRCAWDLVICAFEREEHLLGKGVVTGAQ